MEIKKKYYLDLCSGSKSMQNFNTDLNYISLDIEPKYNPHICCDLLDFDYKDYFKKNGNPVFIWFSPPCNEYSLLNNARPEKIPDIEGSNKIVLKGLEIINYVGDVPFVIENPQTGTLKKQGILDNINYTDVDYCQYGFPYKKRTRLWNNINLKGKKCIKNECKFIKNNRHIYSIGNSNYKTNVKEIGNKKNRLLQRFAVPPLLLNEIKNLVFS
mgnify:FL=1|tara:strand:- start:3830 stop:4471 length:642 start_codon:yes stop_codon:yes gene_type:complete